MKTVAFFGDSFVAKYEGWIEYFCRHEEYKTVHVGKNGGDPIYAFERWVDFNNKSKVVDLCIYAHTSVSRLYHPDADVPLNEGVVEGVLRNEFKTKLDEKDVIFKAAADYYLHLDNTKANWFKSIIVPMGIDRYIRENNTTFVKIIHLWSFAPFLNNMTKDCELNAWPFEMTSGVNIKLDLHKLSCVEPGYIEEKFDTRPLHFSPLAYNFMANLIRVAIKAEDGTALDFKHFTKRKWREYENVLENYKSQYQVE